MLLQLDGGVGGDGGGDALSRSRGSVFTLINKTISA